MKLHWRRKKDHDLEGFNDERLRTHDGLSKRDVPFIISRALNPEYAARKRDALAMNYQTFDYALNDTAWG